MNVIKATDKILKKSDKTGDFYKLTTRLICVSSSFLYMFGNFDRLHVLQNEYIRKETTIRKE